MGIVIFVQHGFSIRRLHIRITGINVRCRSYNSRPFGKANNTRLRTLLQRMKVHSKQAASVSNNQNAQRPPWPCGRQICYEKMHSPFQSIYLPIFLPLPFSAPGHFSLSALSNPTHASMYKEKNRL